MLILGATVAFDYLLKAVLVGMAFYALFGQRAGRSHGRRNLYILFAVFAVLGLYELPAVWSLDATITVGNKEIADFFSLEEKAHLSDLYTIDWWDIIVWLLQAVVASHVADRLCRGAPGQRPSPSTHAVP